jgi:hypothetical protein
MAFSKPIAAAAPEGIEAYTVERLAPAGERVAQAIGAVVIGARLFLIVRSAALG